MVKFVIVTNSECHIHVHMMGCEDEVLIFDNIFEMTVENALNILRERKKLYYDELYFLDEYNRETVILHHGKTYFCKRRYSFF